MIPESLKKRHFYNGVDYVVDEEEKCIKLLPEFHQKLLNNKMWFGKGFKKMTGSVVGNVLCNGMFDSKFAAFCRMAWVQLPMLDDKYVHAGNVIEPKVLDWVRERVVAKDPNGTVQGYESADYGYDYFSDKDDIIGGVPDGFVKPWNILLEVKTTGDKNLSKWESGQIPQNYIKQSSLYAHLMGVDTFIIVACFLKPEDYLHPEDLDINQRVVKQYMMKVDKAQTLRDIETVKEFHKKYAKLGISPKWNDRADKDLLEYLRCKNKAEWIALLEKWDIEGKINSIQESRKANAN